MTLCSWCGHKPHDGPCERDIQLSPRSYSPCPCKKHLHHANQGENQ